MKVKFKFLAASILYSMSIHAYSAEIEIPKVAELTVSHQTIAPLILRFQADAQSIQNTNDITASPKREAVLRSLYVGWLKEIGTISYDKLGLEDQIDYALFKRELQYRLNQLSFERLRFTQVAPLLPSFDSLIELAEARRALVYPDPKATAQVLNLARIALNKKHLHLEKSDSKTIAGTINAIDAFRAAKYMRGLQSDLKDWFNFYNGYDPAFSFWNKTAYDALNKEIIEYSNFLRDKLAGASNPETIIGDPIGREAIIASLRHEMIPFTPEELLKLADQELRWCQNEMQKAALQMGHANWQAALEAVKHLSPEAGEQPKLVSTLADEAMAFLDKYEMVTVPQIARRDWRMTMLSAEAQLQAPFFLGGADVYVAYPAESMPYDKKIMAMRGNNRYFSRAVVHHELIPGHHLQHFYNQRYQTQRYLFDTPFWGEGWAVYWEMLFYDRGFATSPEEKIGMLFWRSHRAARILFSISFHLGKMTPDQAIDLLVERVGHERENAAAEVRRSFAGDYGPLYQAAYMLGGLQFRALREEIVDTGKMSEREFHDSILKGGQMPVSLVRARLLKKSPDPELPANWKFYKFEEKAK